MTEATATTTAATDTATTTAATTTGAATEATGAAATTEAGKTATTTAATTTATTTATDTLATGTDKDSKATPADFPADWREKLAGDDKALLTRLQRLTDPLQLAKTIREQDKEISKRTPAPVKPGADATPEQHAEYRKALGLPLEAGDYLKNLKVPDGRTLGDPDKKIAEDFAKEVGLSDAGLSQAQYDKAIGWYFKRLEVQNDELALADFDYKTKSDDGLRQEWGADYRTNLAFVRAAWGDDESAFNAFMGARGADGQKLGNNPAILKRMAELGRLENPAATIVAAQGQTQSQTIDTEMAAIEKRMREDYNGYMRDNAVQTRYRELVRIKEQAKRSGRAA